MEEGQQMSSVDGHGARTETSAAAPRAELDRPRTGVIAAWIAGTLIAVVAVVIGVNEVFHRVMGAEVSAKVLAQSSTELRELRAEEQARLSRYRWVSRKDGVVRIPLDRAIELTVAEYRARAGRASTGTR
jgi:hypothetical protein